MTTKFKGIPPGIAGPRIQSLVAGLMGMSKGKYCKRDMAKEWVLDGDYKQVRSKSSKVLKEREIRGDGCKELVFLILGALEKTIYFVR